MGKTSITILEETIASTAAAVGGGEIATVLSGESVRGQYNKVYTITSVTELDRILGKTGDEYAYCAYLLNRGNVLKVVREVRTNGANPVKANALIPFGATGDNGLKVEAVEYGQGYNGLHVVVTNQGGTGADNIFSLEVLSSDKKAIFEAFPVVSLNSLSPYYYGKVVKSEIIALSIVGTWTNQTLFVEADPTATPPVVAINSQDVSLANATATSAPANLGTTLAALEDLEHSFATLILPTRTPAQVATDVSSLLTARTDFELLIDPEASTTPDGAVAALATVKKTNACAFYPRLVLSTIDDCPPSVKMADVIADLHKRHLWFKAPAGLEYGLLTDVLDVKTPLTKTQIGALQEGCINPIVVKLGNGVVSWGNYTLAASITDLRDLAARLLTNYFKRTVYRLSQRFIFADHNEFTWNQWKNTVEPIIRDVYNVGGIRAYEVKCDRSTMTQEDINNGILRGTITFWPVSHIEKIVITFGIDQTGVSFE